MRARQAATFAAVEATGLSKTEIGRIAGVHRSQVSRWASGEQQPSYERTMRLAGYLRNEHPALAEEVIAASGYGPPESEPLVDPQLADALRRYVPRDAEETIAKLEQAELERRQAQRPSAEGGDRAAS
jgi:transcriptional regulator with XRE-family HTH domain